VEAQIPIVLTGGIAKTRKKTHRHRRHAQGTQNGEQGAELHHKLAKTEDLPSQQLRKKQGHVDKTQYQTGVHEDTGAYAVALDFAHGVPLSE